MTIRPHFAALLVPLLSAGIVAAQESPKAAALEPAKGCRIFICGHSFHCYIADPLAKLADEAGLKGHTTVGVDFIGGSRPLQHWNVPEAKNKPKLALAGGKVEVLTLSPNAAAPDEGIDSFADLAVKTNPGVRVMLQLSWPTYDGRERAKFKNDDRDMLTAADLAVLRKGGEDYVGRLRKQIQGINERHGRTVAYLVPAGPALLALREKVLSGGVPGVAKQSDLFTDPLGHGKPALKDLVTYCWFAALYAKSPVGLTVLEKKGDDTSRKLHRVLQEIAWQAVTAEPLSGVAGK